MLDTFLSLYFSNNKHHRFQITDLVHTAEWFNGSRVMAEDTSVTIYCGYRVSKY